MTDTNYHLVCSMFLFWIYLHDNILTSCFTRMWLWERKNVLGRQFLRNKTPEDQQQINSRSCSNFHLTRVLLLLSSKQQFIHNVG